MQNGAHFSGPSACPDQRPRASTMWTEFRAGRNQLGAKLINSSWALLPDLVSALTAGRRTQLTLRKATHGSQQLRKS